MPRFDPIYTNFSAGEFSPLLAGRVELEKYGSGCEILENYLPRPHGPAVRRGGMRFIAKAKFGDKKCRMIPFDIGAATGLFHLEFGENYIRFYTQDGQLQEFPPTPYEIATTYTEAELFDLYYIQDANTLFLFHPDHAPAQLVRNNTYDWVLSDIAFTAKPTEWNTAGNNPAWGAFYEQRLIYGGCPGDPSTIWGSKIGAYFNLTIGTNDDDAFKYTVFSEKINLFRWGSSGDILALGGSGGEYKMMSTAFNEAITPTNIKIVRQTNYGAANIMPIRIGSRVLFVQKGQLKVRNFAYRLDSDAYTSEDLTLLSEHITYPMVLESEYTNEPDSIAYYVRSDGQLVGVSYEPEFDINGWFRIVTDGEIESISVTDGWSDTRYDDIYVAVKRTAGGGDFRSIEKWERCIDRLDGVEESFYVDSGITYDGAPTTTITGLDHLEGRTVQVLTDGSVHPDKVVASGSITLDYLASKVHVGLGFVSRLKTMRPEGGNPIGTAQGKTKRLHKSYVRIYRTVGIVVNGERFFMGPPIMNQAVELFTGDIEVPIDDGYEDEGQIEIIQNQPLPSTIVAIMPELRTQ